MSNVSGANLKFGHIDPGRWMCETIYLPPCPVGGTPIETQSGITYRGGGEMHWEVIKEVGETLIDSGSFTMASDLWLQVNGTNGDWSCMWSDEELW